MKSIYATLKQHGRLILLTFEVFWIVIFLLDRLNGAGGGVPTFVYVNF